MKAEALAVSKTLKQRICCKAYLGVRDQDRVNRVKRPRVINMIQVALKKLWKEQVQILDCSGEPNNLAHAKTMNKLASGKVAAKGTTHCCRTVLPHCICSNTDRRLRTKEGPQPSSAQSLLKTNLGDVTDQHSLLH